MKLELDCEPLFCGRELVGLCPHLEHTIIFTSHLTILVFGVSPSPSDKSALLQTLNAGDGVGALTAYR